MKTTPHQPTEFEALLESASDGTLSDQESEVLADYLKSDYRNRKAYAEHMMLNALLSTSDEFSVADSAPRVPVKTQSSAEKTHKALLFPLLAAVAAAVITFIAVNTAVEKPADDQQLQISTLEQRPSQQVSPALRSVARLLVAETTTIPNATPGDWLWPGPIEINEGRIHVAFDTGAEIVLSGPAKLDLQSENRCYLHYGRLTARVPKPATGFAVGSEDGIVIDVGTAFVVHEVPLAFVARCTAFVVFLVDNQVSTRFIVYDIDFDIGTALIVDFVDFLGLACGDSDDGKQCHQGDCAIGDLFT